TFFFCFQAEDGIRDFHVTGVQTCALPIFVTRALRASCASLSSGRGQRETETEAGGDELTVSVRTVATLSRGAAGAEGSGSGIEAKRSRFDRWALRKALAEFSELGVRARRHDVTKLEVRDEAIERDLEEAHV